MQYLDYIYAKKFAIFDMDGTLIDTEPLHINAWNYLADEYGFPKFNKDFIQIIGGRPTLDIAKDLLKNCNNDSDPKVLCERKTKAYREMFLPKAEIFSSILDILKNLKQNGTKIALATGSYQRETLMLLEKFNIKDLFDAIITSDNVKKPKPNPDIYEQALEAIGGDLKNRQNAIVFEDTKLGLQGVKAAKIDCVFVNQGSIVEIIKN